jgi:hypothetical protein
MRIGVCALAAALTVAKRPGMAGKTIELVTARDGLPNLTFLL